MKYGLWGSPLYGDSSEYVENKELSIRTYKSYMFSRLNKMFKYKGLPETIPEEILKFNLMYNGSCAITKVDNQLYTFIGNFGGEPDVYYRPSIYIIANPALRYNAELKMYNLDGTATDEMVLMRNDYFWMGLNPLVSRYASLLAENTITLNMADIMLRVVALLTAPDDNTREAAEQYLKKLKDGKLGVIGENRLFDGIRLQSPPSNNGSYLTQFIELQQYYLGSFYNEIGLCAQYNMKREAMNESETSINEDMLLPLVESMLEVRKEDVERLNELYGLNVEVEFDSSWAENEIQRRLELLRIESEGVNNEESENGSGANGEFTGDIESSGDGEGSITDIDSASDDMERGESSPIVNDGTGDSNGENVINDGGESQTSQADINIQVNVNVGEVEDIKEGEDEDEDEIKEGEEDV